MRVSTNSCAEPKKENQDLTESGLSEMDEKTIAHPLTHSAGFATQDKGMKRVHAQPDRLERMI
jgi:hypothetical protein